MAQSRGGADGDMEDDDGCPAAADLRLAEAVEVRPRDCSLPASDGWIDGGMKGII
jgi:hypothetical protein